MRRIAGVLLLGLFATVGVGCASSGAAGGGVASASRVATVHHAHADADDGAARAGAAAVTSGGTYNLAAREGVPTPEPASPQMHEYPSSGPTPQVPIPVRGIGVSFQ